MTGPFLPETSGKRVSPNALPAIQGMFLDSACAAQLCADLPSAAYPLKFMKNSDTSKFSGTMPMNMFPATLSRSKKLR